jgi:hypothetical protein
LEVLSDGVYLDVYGKETACDIASGKVYLKANGTAAAQLSLDQQVKLKSYFMQISQVSNYVLSKYKSPKKRSGLLGYKLGAIFSGIKGMDETRVEAAIIDALDGYFTGDTLDLNNQWMTSMGENVLNFQARSQNFNVTLNLISSMKN